MKIKLRKTTWDLIKTDLAPSVRGQIDPPSYTKRQLKISNKLKSDKEILEVLLHECLHGCFWDLDESAIEAAALDISKLLYQLGARIDLSILDKK